MIGVDRRIEKIEEIYAMLASSATGGASDELAYRDLREELLDDPILARRLPPVIRTHRGLAQWLGFIKTKYGTYAQRREYLRGQFEPLLIELEDEQRARKAPVKTEDTPPRAFGGRPIATDWMDQFNASRSPATKPVLSLNTAPTLRKTSNSVFIVHGHDQGIREAVARVIERQGLEAVILAERANRGGTVIEKFEGASDVGFVIVLLTADDLGRAMSEPELKPRARQNVILELGYFIGKLGRDRVMALVSEDLEQPSDLRGLVGTAIDRGGAWKARVLQELQAAGYTVDFSKLV